MSSIHSTSIIDPQTVLEDDVFVGPYVIIEGNVRLGRGTKIFSHASIKGPVEIGADNIIYPFVSIGAEPQDIAYKVPSGKIVIGNNNTIREGVTIHAPTAYTDTSLSSNTIIGNNCFLMVNSHIAHNTVLHNNVILANNVLLAGLCTVYEGAFISGNVVIHQGCRIGQNAMISGGSRVGRDIPPFMLLSSFYGIISGLNLVGLRRAGFTVEERASAKEILRIFHQHKSLNPAKDALKEASKDKTNRMFQITLEFLEGSKRGIATFGSWNEEKNDKTVDF